MAWDDTAWDDTAWDDTAWSYMAWSYMAWFYPSGLVLPVWPLTSCNMASDILRSENSLDS